MTPSESWQLLLRLCTFMFVLYLYVRVLRLEDAVKTMDADRKLHVAATRDTEYDVAALEKRVARLEAES